MKIEKLSNGKSKKIVLSIIILLFIIGIIYITNSKAKYQVTKNVQIVNGNVNYSFADFSLMAINLQAEEKSTNYNKVNTVPSTGYIFNENKTYCTIGTTKYEGKSSYNGQGITINYIGDHVTFGGVKTANTKCYLYFDIIPNLTPEERITELGLSAISSEGCPTYPEPTISGVESSKTLLCRGKDTDGDTYYFRGKADKNWVQMGSTYWRIIRINGDGTIRLIYNGTRLGATGSAANYKSEVAFNSAYDQAEYVGLKFTLGFRHGNETGTSMFNALNSFYNEYFDSDKPLAAYASKRDHSAGFCGDRTSTTNYNVQTPDNTGGTGKTTTYYGPYFRTYKSRKSIFKCPDMDNDLYTTNFATRGNKALDYPVGLITIDEVMYAGAYENADNSGYWLYTGEEYWTMSPYLFDSKYAYGYSVYSNGRPTYKGVYSTLGVRPVINLKADTTFTGEGTTGNPFVVQL